MSDTNLAVEFYNAFGLGQLVESSNFKFYGELRDALKEDHKHQVDFGEEVDFIYALNNTQDLFDNQASITDDLVSAWAQNALAPLVISLQKCSEYPSANISIDYSDIGSYNGSFTFDDIENYTSVLSPSEAKQALEVLDGWRNTLEHCLNADELIEALNDTINETEEEDEEEEEEEE